MTRDEARRLVQRMEGLWPERAWTEARRHEWLEEFEAEDYVDTTVVLGRLRTSEKHCPSIADFVGAMRALRGPSSGPPLPNYVPTDDERERVHAYLVVLREEMAERRAQSNTTRWGKS